MTIGEVSEKYNLSVDTLRYYEKIGLIENVPRLSGKREYQETELERIQFILCMKNAGFSLENIVKFLSFYKEGDVTIPKRLEMLVKQREKLVEEMKEKQKTLDFLNYKVELYSKK